MDTLMIGLTPPVEGGSQRHIYEVSSRLGCEVLTQRGSICKNKIELPVISSPNLLLNLTFFFVCLIYSFKLLLFKRHKIIHIHENLLYPLAILLKLRYKVVITVHGITGFKFYDLKFLWFFYRLGLKAANKVISVSINDKMLLDRELNNVIYIPNGVDIVLYNKIKPKIKKTITFLGRIHEQKGVSYLVEAFSSISKNFPEFTLEIIGKKEGKLYERLAQKNPSNKIDWKGFILDRKKLFSELASSYMLVYPSLWEALPWPALLEGLASGRPIVASSLDGMREVFSDNQNILLCSPGNSKSIAEKIELLLKNKALAEKIGKQGKILARNFDWGSVSKQIKEQYEKL